MQALEVYRTDFKPSKHLEKPYVMVGVPLAAAENDGEAERLASSALQRHLKLIRGESIFVPPPVESMQGLWTESEKFMVESKLTVAVIGGPETVKSKLATLLRETAADEFIFTSDLYDHEKRLRSFEIASSAMKELATKELQQA